MIINHLRKHLYCYFLFHFYFCLLSHSLFRFSFHFLPHSLFHFLFHSLSHFLFHSLSHSLFRSLFHSLLHFVYHFVFLLYNYAMDFVDLDLLDPILLNNLDNRLFFLLLVFQMVLYHYLNKIQLLFHLDNFHKWIFYFKSYTAKWCSCS